MNKHKKHGHNYQYEMDIRRKRIWRKRCYSNENLVKTLINSIIKEPIGVRIIFVSARFLQLITFLCEYVLYEIQNIFINKSERYLIKNNKIYIVLLIFYSLQFI
jgi:hypothetical protein